MNQHSVTIRTANPTFEDGMACSRYADEASEGFILTTIELQNGFAIIVTSLGLIILAGCGIAMYLKRPTAGFLKLSYDAETLRR